MTTIEPPNPYAPPRAELDVPAPEPARTPANLEAALAGRFDFTIGEVMDEAWHHVKGMKASFWGAAIVFTLINVAVNRVSNRIFGMFVDKPHLVVQMFFRSVIGALMAPVSVGMTMMCVRRALGAPISFATAFRYYGKSLPVLGCALVTVVLTWAGLFALVLPGVYLYVAYFFAIPLICDQGLSPWKALETSRRAVTHKWFSVFGLTLLVAVLTLVSALGLLIPLIWTFPWMAMTTAVLYRRIFYASPPGPPGAVPLIPPAFGAIR
jgi:hypothetical protein